MLPSISIDITDISQEFSFGKENSDNFMKSALLRIVDSFWLDWVDSVKNSDLRSTKQVYLQSMYRNKLENNVYELGLEPGSWLAKAVELGISAFDEKEGFFKSSKAKISKEGKKYFIIPFKQATSEAVATSQVFSNIMPKEVHMAAKKAGEENRQVRLNDLPEQFRIPSTRPKTTLWNNEVKEEYQHKSSIYEGIQKSNKAFHSGYVSFRVASELEPNAFIHTGIQARNLMNNIVEQYRDASRIGEILDDELSVFLGE